ncbi:ATP phosphoribosyltransferase regulatory subunit [Lactococcus kimchii]|uniref:ATP phosphoribosyltransferase regulatory subunit n=1 Tax=Lactococcus sp. S-13 TaxID=2507158 RepID=UPI0010230477|nr:ATP phosphoribosyltransferase regulatory subunit [Lactococcus sp. S-13]RZI48231.1 ATP phosphoribosyltransferase regulatory subunit [Lactococcus sp. S-13]
MNKTNYSLPEEAAEMTLQQVRQLRRIEQQLRDIFGNSSYQEVIPPSFEYTKLYTELQHKDSQFNQEKIFQFINHEGRTISLRYDFTIPLARTYAQNNKSGVSRYSYFGKVFRKEKRHKGRRTEAYQIGVERFGGDSQTAEREIFQLALETTSQLGLDKIIWEIGSASFFYQLYRLVGEAPEFTEILSKKNLSGMIEFIEIHKFSPALNQLLKHLLIKNDLESLSDLVEATTDPLLISAFKELEQRVQEISIQSRVQIDLAMVPSMDYYTGLMFSAYCEAVSQPILSGGRYDQLLAHFGENTVAIGFCCHLDNVLKALENQEIEVKND